MVFHSPLHLRWFSLHAQPFTHGVAADKASLYRNFTVACNTWMALPFPSQGSVVGGFKGYSWSSSSTLVLVAFSTVPAWWLLLTKPLCFKTLPSLVIHGWLFLLHQKGVFLVAFRVFHGYARLGWSSLHAELFTHGGYC